MGVTIQFESHRVELAGIYEMEHDAEVLEFYDQAIQIKLSYEGPGGKRLGVLTGLFRDTHDQRWLGGMENRRGSRTTGKA
jgi:hypothetical protein